MRRPNPIQWEFIVRLLEIDPMHELASNGSIPAVYSVRSTDTVRSAATAQDGYFALSG
jgi:hypothetical protein